MVRVAEGVCVFCVSASAAQADTARAWVYPCVVRMYHRERGTRASDAAARRSRDRVIFARFFNFFRRCRGVNALFTAYAAVLELRSIERTCSPRSESAVPGVSLARSDVRTSCSAKGADLLHRPECRCNRGSDGNSVCQRLSCARPKQPYRRMPLRVRTADAPVFAEQHRSGHGPEVNFTCNIETCDDSTLS